MTESKHTPELASTPPTASPWPTLVWLGPYLFQNSYDDGSYYCYELRGSIRFADPALLAKAQGAAK